MEGKQTSNMKFMNVIIELSIIASFFHPKVSTRTYHLPPMIIFGNFEFLFGIKDHE